MLEIIGPHYHYSFSQHKLELLIALFIWETIWKLIAFWRAGRNKQLGWFIVMAIINTAGLLEILYLLFFQKKRITERQEN
jgi:hypothetical protein